MAAVSDITDLVFRRHAQDLLAQWQTRLLRDAITVEDGVAKPRDPLGMCVMSMLAHSYDDAMPVLLRLLGARGIGAPMLCSAAKIAKTSHVMADFVDRFGNIHRNQSVFRNKKHMEGSFRRLADKLNLDDADRVEMFAAIRRWVVADFRLDPTMNPNDPDAVRLTVH